jgi:Tfp pilus assembly protein PilF
MASGLHKKKWGLVVCLLIFTFFEGHTALALDKRESRALSHYILAAMHEGLGEIDQAIQEYKNSLRSDNKSLSIHLGLVSCYIKKNDIPKAINELNTCIRLDPEAIEPHAILAIIYSAQGKGSLAQKEYEFALKNASKIEPKNIDIYKGLGIIYLQQRKFQDAEKTYRLILDLAPNDSEAHFYLANIYDELKNRDLTIKELKKALELKPDYAEALNYLGYLYVEEGSNLDQAEVMIKKALEIEPDNGAYVDSLGWLYFKKGNLPQALKELEMAGKLLQDPVIYDHLGDAYLKAGNTNSARAFWERSLKLNPGQEEVKKKLEGLGKPK